MIEKAVYLLIYPRQQTPCSVPMQYGVGELYEFPVWPPFYLSIAMNYITGLLRLEYIEYYFHELKTLRWRHNGRDGVSNHQPPDCLLNRLFRRRSKKTSKLCVAGLWAGNSPGPGEFLAQMASNAENASIWWRHHDKLGGNSSWLLY